MDHQISLRQLNTFTLLHDLAAWFHKSESKTLTALIQFVDGEIHATYEVTANGRKQGTYPTLKEAADVYNSI